MHNSIPHNIPLGKHTPAPQHYSPALLAPIARQAGRHSLGLTQADTLPFTGHDRWTAYEMSWLNAAGKPQVAVAEFTFACTSPYLIESKSLKLYLNSLNDTVFASTQALGARLQHDLSSAAQSDVTVQLHSVAAFAPVHATLTHATPICLDELKVSCSIYQPNPALLSHATAKTPISETIYSHLLKSNCPVTGQPDWATIWIHYQGQPICHESLLLYIISYRHHQGFHEQCIEQIYCDIMQRCAPSALAVYACYTRRGGLDISPYRTTPGSNWDHAEAAAAISRWRCARQ